MAPVHPAHQGAARWRRSRRSWRHLLLPSGANGICGRPRHRQGSGRPPAVRDLGVDLHAAWRLPCDNRVKAGAAVAAGSRRHPWWPVPPLGLPVRVPAPQHQQHTFWDCPVAQRGAGSATGRAGRPRAGHPGPPPARVASPAAGSTRAAPAVGPFGYGHGRGNGAWTQMLWARHHAGDAPSAVVGAVGNLAVERFWALVGGDDGVAGGPGPCA